MSWNDYALFVDDVVANVLSGTEHVGFGDVILELIRFDVRQVERQADGSCESNHQSTVSPLLGSVSDWEILTV